MDTESSLRGRRGRPRTNFFSFIQADLKEHNIRLNNTDDFYELRDVASDRAKWRNMFRTLSID